jgi:7-cyano-7-deazaguanine synthase
MARKAIVLLSGGLDSAVCLYLAKSEGYICDCLFFEYGQRHAAEKRYAALLAEQAGSRLECVRICLPWGGSSLIDCEAVIPAGRSPDKIREGGIPSTYVPGRNTIFLGMAASFAEAAGAEAIFIGAHQDDSSGYPDCTRDYLEKFEHMIKSGTRAGREGRLGLKYPLIDMSKSGIIKLGTRLKVPFELTRSCYERGDTPCGVCDACVLRAKGFSEANVKDPAVKDATAEISDIFSSIQGEGIFLGERQIFVRFKECNLTCDYCDERTGAATHTYTAGKLAEKVSAIEKTEGGHHSVSLTGGEPLCYAGFLKQLLPVLRGAGMKIYLETNGTLPGELKKVIDLVDIIAMDLKLPSATRSADHWREHAEFLRIAAAKTVFVKAVVTRDTYAGDVEKAARLVRECGRSIPFIIQPASPAGNAFSPGERALAGFMEIGIRNGLESVEVIGQKHKEWGVK